MTRIYTPPCTYTHLLAHIHTSSHIYTPPCTYTHLLAYTHLLIPGWAVDISMYVMISMYVIHTYRLRAWLSEISMYVCELDSNLAQGHWKEQRGQLSSSTSHKCTFLCVYLYICVRDFLWVLYVPRSGTWNHLLPWHGIIFFHDTQIHLALDHGPWSRARGRY